MKLLQNILLLVVVLFTVNVTAQRYNSYGIKLGSEYINNNPVDGYFFNKIGSDTFNITTDPNFGWHAGGFFIAHLDPVYFQLELRFSTAKYNTEISDTSTSFNDDINFRINNLYLPIGVGAKFGSFRGQIGLSPGLYLYSGDVSDYDDLNKVSKSAYLNYHFGVGIDVWRFMFDLQYERQFRDRYIKIDYENDSFQYKSQAPRLSLSIGFMIKPPKTL